MSEFLEIGLIELFAVISASAIGGYLYARVGVRRLLRILDEIVQKEDGGGR